MTMRRSLSCPEVALLAAGAALLLLAWFGPAIGEPVGYQQFADRRTLAGLPMAMDVLSNIGFAAMGAWGWVVLWNALPALRNVQRAMAAMFFTGLLLTAAGSTWYHLAPDEAGLVIDRCGMAVAFAGLLGLAAAARVSERAGAWLGLAFLLLGPVAARAALVTGNVLPWAVLQFGGMALVLVLALRGPRHAELPIRWSLLLLAYAVAKLLELNDEAIFELTQQTVSGHTLKHVAAALAAAPVISALRNFAEPGQNAASATTTSHAAGRSPGHA
jgi:hypothetical protein